ncbi:hypothetical protein AGIG_G6875 [Arapaima gigas]
MRRVWQSPQLTPQEGLREDTIGRQCETGAAPLLVVCSPSSLLPSPGVEASQWSPEELFNPEWTLEWDLGEDMSTTTGFMRWRKHMQQTKPIQGSEEKNPNYGHIRTRVALDPDTQLPS